MTTTISKKDFDKALQDNVVLKDKNGTGGYLRVNITGEERSPITNNVIGDQVIDAIGIAYEEKNGVRIYSLNGVKITTNKGKDITEQYKQPQSSTFAIIRDAGISATQYLLGLGGIASLSVGVVAMAITVVLIAASAPVSLPTLGVAGGGVVLAFLCGASIRKLSAFKESLKEFKETALESENNSPPAEKWKIIQESDKVVKPFDTDYGRWEKREKTGGDMVIYGLAISGPALLITLVLTITSIYVPAVPLVAAGITVGIAVLAGLYTAVGLGIMTYYGAKLEPVIDRTPTQLDKTSAYTHEYGSSELPHTDNQTCLKNEGHHKNSDRPSECMGEESTESSKENEGCKD